MAKTVSGAAISLFDTPTSRDTPEKTFVIFGSPRGGTTAVAGCVRQLGVFLGDRLPDNLEDPKFSGRPGEIGKVVGARNADHQVWGWKFPNAVNYLDAISGKLRNSRYICVTRDLTANALGIEARHDSFNTLRAIEHAMMNAQRNLSFVMRVRRPTLMLSYEKLALKPEQAVSEMAAFLAMAPSDDLLKAAVENVTPGQYVSQRRTKLKSLLKN